MNVHMIAVLAVAYEDSDVLAVSARRLVPRKKNNNATASMQHHSLSNRYDKHAGIRRYTIRGLTGMYIREAVYIGHTMILDVATSICPGRHGIPLRVR